MSKLKYSAGNVAATHYDNPSGGGSLDIMGSMFMGSVQKTPGTEVADDIESTSCPGPLQKRCTGKILLIFIQWVPKINITCCFVTNPMT